MPRPTVVIGLGGTGQWVLTYVKKDLLEINREKMPSNVRLVAFDTMPQATAETAMATGGREKEVKVGSVKLDPETEFVHLGGNVFGLAQQVMAGEHPQLGSWFQAKEWLNTLGEGAFSLAAGSGQIRAFGRMAVFNDLMLPASSKVWTALTSAIRAIQNEVGDPQQGMGKYQLEIILVGSLAGGTGAGMLMDMALLARAAARSTVQKNFILRGFVALPRTFGFGTKGFAPQEMQSRAYAAWRELDRFMICRQDFGLRRMQYHEKWAPFNVDIDTSLFDVCYLIDPVRQPMPLNAIPPEEGVFPSISAAISAILDSQAGRQYTEHVTTNIQPARQLRPGIPLHSSMGTYTVKVPVYFNMQDSAYSYGIQVLDHLLRPIKDKQTGTVTGLETAHNNEKRLGQRGAEEVPGFLGIDLISRGKGENVEAVRNTRLLQTIGDVVQKGGPSTAAMVAEYARGSLAEKGSKAQEILDLFTDLGETPEMKNLRDEIADTLNARVILRVPPSRQFGDTPEDAVIRFRNKIPEFRDEHIGTELPDGTVAGGKFATALERCAEVHRRRFASLLRLWSLNTLMGGSGAEADIVRARSGKLGYATDFYESLGRTFDTFLQFMEKVRQERTELKFYQEAQNRRARAERVMVANSPRKILFRWPNPRALSTQEIYLRAEQRLIDVRKDELLHEAAVKVVRALREVVEQARLEAEQWKVAFATGDAPTQLQSLYQNVVQMEKSVGVSHMADGKIAQIQELRGVVTYEPQPDQIALALKAFVWDVTTTNDRFTIQCRLQLPERVEVLRYDRDRKGGQLAVQANLNAFRELAQSPFASVPSESKVGWVMAHNHTGTEIAEGLYQKGEPLWTPSTGAHFGSYTRSDYIRVSHNFDPDVKATWEEARQALQNKYQTGQGGVPVFLVESEDLHKCTSFRSDDMMESRDFDAWAECRKAYLQTVNDPNRKASLLYIFPAERYAAEYEQLRVQKLKLQYKEFRPKVVMVLEDKARTKSCLLSLIYGVIKIGRSGEVYELALEGQSPMLMTLPGESSGRNDLFTILDTFVLLGKDRDPNSTNEIDYQRVDEALAKAKNAAGTAQQNIDKLTERIASLGQARTSAADLLGGLRLEKEEEFRDLADVFQLMLLEEVETLQKRKAMEPSSTASA